MTCFDRPILYKDDGETFKAGDIMKLPTMAQTLRRIANGGATEFYEGSLARDIIADLREHGK